MLIGAATYTHTNALTRGCWPSPLKAAHSRCRPRSVLLLAATPAVDQRRANLVKQRTPPRKKRFKKTLDQPRRLNVRPSDPEFEGRITTELNSVYGPKKLTKLVEDYGPHLTAGHLASALAVLAGFITGKAMPDSKLEEYRRPARRCAELMRARVGEASHIDCARAAYSLARLRVHDPTLLSLLADHTTDRLATFTPESLAGLAAGLGAWGHRPSDTWLSHFAVESFSRLTQFNAQELSNTLFGLAQMNQRPSDVWLARCLQLMRGQWGGPRCHAPSLVKAVCALAVLGARPGFNWTCAFLAEARRQIDKFSPREMASLLWALVRMKHAPDVLFIDAWCRSAALRLRAFPADALVLAVHALGALAPGGGGVAGGVPGRFAGRLLLRCGEVVGQLGGDELAQMAWGLAALRLRPEDEWLEAWAAALEPKMAELNPQALADVAWALARMRATPSQPWMDALYSAVDAQLPDMGATPLAVLLWAVARLKHRPRREWLLAFKAKAGSQFEAATVAQLTRFIAIAVAGQQRQVQQGPPMQQQQGGLGQSERQPGALKQAAQVSVDTSWGDSDEAWQGQQPAKQRPHSPATGRRRLFADEQ